MNGTDIIILILTIICVAGLICATIKRNKKSSKNSCSGCPFCNEEGCPFNNK